METKRLWKSLLIKALERFASIPAWSFTVTALALSIISWVMKNFFA